MNNMNAFSWAPLDKKDSWYLQDSSNWSWTLALRCLNKLKIVSREGKVEFAHVCISFTNLLQIRCVKVCCRNACDMDALCVFAFVVMFWCPVFSLFTSGINVRFLQAIFVNGSLKLHSVVIEYTRYIQGVYMYRTGMFVCISVYHCSLCFCFCLIYNLYAILTHLWYKDLHVFSEHVLNDKWMHTFKGWMAGTLNGSASLWWTDFLFQRQKDFCYSFFFLVFYSLYCHSSPIAACRWEHDDWHHSACALLWQEGEGGANVWRLL